MPVNFGALGDVGNRIWAWLRRRFSDALYKAPMQMGRRWGLQVYHLILFYLYSSIVALSLWIVPWIGLLIWYLAIIQGCQWKPTRALLQEICLQSLPSHEVPWYLDLWNLRGNSTNHADVDLPLFIERLMIGHDRLLAATTALRDQIPKTELAAQGRTTDELLGSVRTWQMAPRWLIESPN